jgi:hypothetical protein
MAAEAAANTVWMLRLLGICCCWAAAAANCCWGNDCRQFWDVQWTMDLPIVFVPIADAASMSWRSWVRSRTAGGLWGQRRRANRQWPGNAGGANWPQQFAPGCEEKEWNL